jgi:hypothetical protein
MPDLNVVRTITIRSKTEGVDQSTASLKNLKGAHDQLGASAQKTATITDMASRSQLSLTDALRRSQAQLNANIKAQQDFQKANSNVATSYADMERSKAEFDRGLVSSIEDTLNLINHLKLLGLAAYAMVPAFRSFVNTEARAGVGLMGAEFSRMLPTLSAIGQRALPYIREGLSFFARLTIPITAAIALFETLNYLIKTGSDLLSKYSIEQQRINFGTGASTDAQLARMTRFQPDISADQAQTAAELQSRLAAAKQQLNDFWRTEIDVTDVALSLQRVWVTIVETIARAATAIGNLKSTTESYAQSFGNSPIWKWILEHTPTVGGLGSLPGALVPGPGGILPGTAPPQEDTAAAMAAARRTLAAGIQGGTSFQGRWEAMFAQPSAPDVTKASNAYTNFIDKIQTTISELELEVQGANKTSEAIEELKIHHEGVVAAQKAGIAITPKMEAEWKAYADTISRLNLELRQTKALQEEQFKFATAFMSPENQAAATVAKQIDPQNWQAHLQDAAAQLARFNSQLTQARDIAVSFGDNFEQAMLQGKSGTEALMGALRNLESQLLSMINKIGINALFSLISAPTAGPSFLGGGNWLLPAKAKGDAFQDGRVIPFASGGIVTSPTIFPMQGGAGLMGEAGPEAVMPLTRDSSGKLGVQGAGVVNNFIVENHTGGQVSEQRQKNSTGGIDHRLIIRAAVAEDLASGAYDGPMRARFGQQIRARPR